MSNNALLSFGHSADLLEQIFPGENWQWFLSKNIHGLTTGFSTIRFDNNASDIAFFLGDLERFAIEFGKDKLSAEAISSMFDQYEARLNLQELVATIEGDSSLFGSSREFFQQANIDDDGSVHLDIDDVSALLTTIQKIAEEQLETGYALTTMAQAIRAAGCGMQLTPEEATALSGVAIAQAGRACDNAERIRSLFNEITAAPAQ